MVAGVVSDMESGSRCTPAAAKVHGNIAIDLGCDVARLAVEASLLSQSAAVGVAMYGAAGEVDGCGVGSGGSDRLRLCAVVRCILDIGIGQCTAAVDVAVHLSSFDIYLYATAHVGQVSAAVDVACHHDAGRGSATCHQQQ